MKKFFILWIILNFVLITSHSQCTQLITAFKPGEKLYFEVKYNWQFIWVNAGEVWFQVDSSQYEYKKVYTLSSFGTSYKSYDWFFKVREHFKSYINPITMQPYKFERNSYEGGYTAKEIYKFDNNKIYSSVETSSKPLVVDTINISSCVWDVLTATYYCRNLNFSKYKAGDSIPVPMIIDGQVYNLFIRYINNVILTLPDGKKYRCIKFSAMLLEGTMFKGGEQLFVWVTNDENKIPIYIEAQIVVGTVKVYLKSATGLKHPSTAQIN